MTDPSKTSKEEKTSSDTQHEFFVRTASGLEQQLALELKELDIKRVRSLSAGVAFFGSYKDAYRVCLWSRVASRVLSVLARIDASDADTLYRGIQTIDWTQHLGVDTAIAVHAHGVNGSLRNTQFTAVRVKDAICDQMRDKLGSRPSVRQTRPDVLIDISLRGSKATVSLDFSGEPLHRRGYREPGKQSEAPLKESLAAGIVLASGWKELASKGGIFIDPLCGSGTLAIEAALIAAHRAPGIMRDYWGFKGWKGFDPIVWDGLLKQATEAEAEAEAAEVEAVAEAEAQPAKWPRIFASDIDESCVGLARANAQRAGVADLIEFSVADVACMKEFLDSVQSGLPIDNTDSDSSQRAGEAKSNADASHSSVPIKGVMVTNPPYGQRLLSGSELPALYTSLAEGVEMLEGCWRLAIITPDETIDSALGLVPLETLPLYNGKIPVKLRIYEAGASDRVTCEIISLQGKERRVVVTERNSEQFAARFRKVAKERMKWARKNAVQCFRLYDADLPDYVVAIDWYEGAGPSEHEHAVLVSEYKAPAEIESSKASRRFHDVLTIIPAVLDIDPKHIAVKTRRREKGGGQYQDAKGSARVLYTRESGYLIEVDLGAYLDTGLFLDHRPTRMLIGEMAQGKRFLNLFAYTGVASIHAAGGGAASTKTVDLSHTYLAWAKRNMERNGFTGAEHHYERADITQWIVDECARGNQYDLIFVDPPTFSNSKAMKDASWSVQRDHITLLAGVKKLLADGGHIVFSCNLRSFKPDTEALEALGLTITDITAQTIPHDFARTPKVHHCYLLQEQ